MTTSTYSPRASEAVRHSDGAVFVTPQEMTPSEPPDAQLLSACRAGDREAFGHFYVRHREVLLSYLGRRVREPEVAADLMAETFAAALVAIKENDRQLPAVPAAWLFTIARNLLVDSIRKGRVDMNARHQLRLEPVVLEDADLERIIEITASHDAVAELAAAVPAAEWEAFRAYVLEDESYAEMATRLQCSEALVRKRVSRAKAHLRTALGGTNA